MKKSSLAVFAFALLAAAAPFLRCWYRLPPHTPNGFCPGGRSLPRRHAAAFAHDAAQQCSKRYHRP